MTWVAIGECATAAAATGEICVLKGAAAEVATCKLRISKRRMLEVGMQQHCIGQVCSGHAGCCQVSARQL